MAVGRGHFGKGTFRLTPCCLGNRLKDQRLKDVSMFWKVSKSLLQYPFSGLVQQGFDPPESLIGSYFLAYFGIIFGKTREKVSGYQ